MNAKQQYKTEQDSSRDFSPFKDSQDVITEEETFYDTVAKLPEKEKGQCTDIPPSSKTSQQDSTNSKDQQTHEKSVPKGK